MAYRVPLLEIPTDNPFKNDALERRPIVEFLAGLIERTGGPFVLALDSPWGTGKTTLVKMLDALLKQKDFSCIYFNAWQVDYVTDPLVALVSSIDRVELGIEEPAKAEFSKRMKTVRRVTSLVAKRAAVATAKVLTAGVLDLDGEIKDALEELAGDSVTDIVESFQKEAVLLEKFKTELEGAIEELHNAGKKKTLIFFVDEIDRCRPTFAIELLERIKHLFDTPNILFVLSLDKQQLEASVAAVYGEGINSAEYLRRFIDLEYQVPILRQNQFVENLFMRLGLNEIFSARTHHELQSDKSTFVSFFSDLAQAFPLTLRAQERCLTRLHVVMDQTPSTHYLEPALVALLIVLRASQPDLFLKLSNGSATTNDVIGYLKSLPGGKKLISGRPGVFLEACLISADDNYERRDKTLEELRETINNHALSAEIRQRASDLHEVSKHLTRGTRDISFSRICKKIDLAAWIN